jgi:uncharacterized membrane protein YheB (UPF0754 family)
MMTWGLLLAPVLGAAIGYGTNWLAIKMLFWPQKPVFLLKRRLPMTPGLFVSRRNQFARQLAQSVEDGFLSGPDLCQALAQASRSGFLEKIAERAGTPGLIVFSFICDLDSSTIRRMADSLSVSVKDSGMVKSVIEEKVASMDVDEVEEMVMNVVERELGVITLLGGVLGLVVGSIQPLVWLLA